METPSEARSQPTRLEALPPSAPADPSMCSELATWKLRAKRGVNQRASNLFLAAPRLIPRCSRNWPHGNSERSEESTDAPRSSASQRTGRSLDVLGIGNMETPSEARSQPTRLESLPRCASADSSLLSELATWKLRAKRGVNRRASKLCLPAHRQIPRCARNWQHGNSERSEESTDAPRISSSLR